MERWVRLIVTGKVQGVFFRDYTRKKATRLGLKGTVRNRSDGSVEIHVQGTDSLVKALEQWCWEGSPYSKVTNVVSQNITAHRSYSDFRVIYE